MSLVPGAVQGANAARSTTRVERVVLLAPGLAVTTVLMAIPVSLVLAYTLFQRGPYGGIVYSPTVDNLRRLFEPVYRSVLFDSMLIAGAATALAFLIGYPTAYAISRLKGAARTVALVLVVIPFWTNFLIRTYAWVVLLNSRGVVPSLLVKLGLVDHAPTLLYTRWAVVAGLLYAYLPLMILPLYASLARVDPELREAARNLGASRARSFLDMHLKLTLPGVVTGCIFVFVPSLGNFVVPELLGGGKTTMVGNLVRDQFLAARDWPFGAALSLILVGVLFALFAAQSKITRRYTVGTD